jgi:hypothetical protein
VSFLDHLDAVIDRPCRGGCGGMLAEDCPSEFFCSETCEARWRTEHNGCEFVDEGDGYHDVLVPAGHPAEPTYVGEQPPKSLYDCISEYVAERMQAFYEYEAEQFRRNARAAAMYQGVGDQPGLNVVAHGRSNLDGSAELYSIVRPTGPEEERPPAVGLTPETLQAAMDQVARLYDVRPEPAAPSSQIVPARFGDVLDSTGFIEPGQHFTRGLPRGLLLPEDIRFEFGPLDLQANRVHFRIHLNDLT